MPCEIPVLLVRRSVALRRRAAPGTALLIVVLAALAQPGFTAAEDAPIRPTGRSDIPLPISADGRALLPIIVSPHASEQTRAVAAELADYLRRITGAAFDVREGDGSSGIVLGTLAEFPNPTLAKSLEMHGPYDGREAYAIRTEKGRLLLIGGADLGASHAASRFLEYAGCRWFFPAKNWEVIPSVPNLKCDPNETDRPTFLARRIWYGYGFFRDPGEKVKSQTQLDYESWARHNRMAGSFTVHCGHAWQAIILQNKAEFENHPEYRALVKGVRQGDQLCVSNPAVRKLAVSYALDHLRKHPEADMVSMETSDGLGHCECDDCKKLGSISDRAFGLANEVARAVAKEFPGKMVGMLAYSNHSEPPTFELEPNVYVQLTVGFIMGRYSFDELADLWPAKCKNMGFYDYFSVWLWDFDRLPGGRGGDVQRTRDEIHKFAARHASSMDAESGDNWGPHGRGYYVANRLMWNPDADVDAILADFYDKAFGPAAGAMKRYYERLDPGSKPLMSRSLLGQAFRDIEEACRLAKDRPDVLARLADLKQYLHFIHLTWLLDHETDKAKKKELTLAAITHAYRTRRTYMNHWAAIRQTWAGKAAKEFDEPSWASDVKGKKPWTDAGPITAEETESDFSRALAYFQPQQVKEKTFSSDLVPVKFPEMPKVAKKVTGKLPGGPVISSQYYQGGLRYALFSITGEPIELEVVTGTIAWYRDRPDARYSLRTASDGIVTEGRLKLDGETHPLSLKVPGPGLYYFDFADSGAGWKIHVAAGRPCTIPLLRDKKFSHAGQMQRMYFYVPKHTATIEYYWQGRPHKVIDPQGKVVQEVKSSGEFVSIPVPPGMDGQLWSFTQLALGHLWFFNLPNYLAASPEALLLPRQVAEDDGLGELK
jgi:hypothetical protein